MASNREIDIFSRYLVAEVISSFEGRTLQEKAARSKLHPDWTKSDDVGLKDASRHSQEGDFMGYKEWRDGALNRRDESGFSLRDESKWDPLRQSIYQSGSAGGALEVARDFIINNI
jgi:hypothetical protein